MKKLMKNLTMAAILLAAAMASESALAQVEVVTNDLYLGFENEAGGGTANYIVNLGQASTIVGGTTVVNLNSDVSLTDFDSAGLNGTNSADIMCGVVGGNASSGGTLAHFYVTQTRSGGAGVPSVAGSTAPPPESVSEVSADYTALSQMQDLPSAGNGLLDSTLEWQNDVEPAETPSTVYGSVGVNPDSSVTTSATTYEDLWAATNKYFFTTNFVYQG